MASEWDDSVGAPSADPGKVSGHRAWTEKPGEMGTGGSGDGLPCLGGEDDKSKAGQKGPTSHPHRGAEAEGPGRGQLWGAGSEDASGTRGAVIWAVAPGWSVLGGQMD